MRILCILSGLTMLLTSPTGRADQADDEALLRGAKVAPDVPGLLAFFRSRVALSEGEGKVSDTETSPHASRAVSQRLPTILFFALFLIVLTSW